MHLDENTFDELLRNAQRASSLLKAMSNEHRLLILCQLSQGEKCVGELEVLVRLSQSALSQHLARLRNDKLVKTRREKQTIYYSLNGIEAAAVMQTLYTLYCTHDVENDTGDVSDAAPGPVPATCHPVYACVPSKKSA